MPHVQIPNSTKEGGQMFTLELWDDAKGLAGGLADGMEVVALGRLRRQREGQVGAGGWVGAVAGAVWWSVGGSMLRMCRIAGTAWNDPIGAI